MSRQQNSIDWIREALDKGSDLVVATDIVIRDLLANEDIPKNRLAETVNLAISTFQDCSTGSEPRIRTAVKIARLLYLKKRISPIECLILAIFGNQQQQQEKKETLQKEKEFKEKFAGVNPQIDLFKSG